MSINNKSSLIEKDYQLGHKRTSGVNNFVVRFANINGTGSASANFLFAKSIFRMGVPVTPKNIFPSNIQGLPTWYEVRVSEKGYLGRREGVDLMVAMNLQSMPQDVQSVVPGGYLLYDSSKPLAEENIRKDINYLGVPIAEMCLMHYTEMRQRQLYRNIVYVGALAALLNIDVKEIEKLISEQFEGKKEVIQSNIHALHLGVDFAIKNFKCPLNIRVERRNLLGNSIMIDGNSACGLGAIYAGATVAAWYPITPSTSLIDAFSHYANIYRTDKKTGKKNVAIVQAEDELAAIGIAIGAMWNGARAFTATSGPGLSLMNEFLGLAYFAEVPVVLIDVQRVGPSTGMPTRTQQSDLLNAAYASHGDTKNVLLFPSTPKEAFDMTIIAFDLAEYLQTPVIVMSDLDLGMNDHISPPLEWDDNYQYNRGKIFTAEDLERKEFGRYLDVDKDGIPYRTIPATHPTKGAFVTRGTSHDEYAKYTESPEVYKRIMDRLLVKWNTAKNLVPPPKLYQNENKSELGILFFGTSLYPVEEAIDLLNEYNITLDAICIKAFPFNKTVEDFIASHKKIFVVEQNRDAQMKSLLTIELQVNPEKLISILNYDGLPITADFIFKEIIEYVVSLSENKITEKI